MLYNIGIPSERDQFPNILINNEDDLWMFNHFRNSPIISFELVMQTLKEQLEIEHVTIEQLGELYEAIYEGIHPLICDAADEVFTE